MLWSFAAIARDEVLPERLEVLSAAGAPVCSGGEGRRGTTARVRRIGPGVFPVTAGIGDARLAAPAGSASGRGVPRLGIGHKRAVLGRDPPSPAKASGTRTWRRRNQRGGHSRPGTEDERHLVGTIDPQEAQCLQELRRETRLRRRALETERAYANWVSRFMRHCGSEDLRQFGDREIKSFLTQLAVEGNVTPNTQNQAKSALLFLFQQVFQRELGFLDAVPADKPERLPVVLSREEISRLWPLFRGLRDLMFQLMYGAGLRHRECRRLRVKDVCFDEGHIIVRSGKGDQDRITVLPQRVRDALRAQIEAARRLHQRDLDEGLGQVYLPHALERKYPNENREFGWQWIFPSRQPAKDPRSASSADTTCPMSSSATSSSKPWIARGSSRTPCRIRCGTVSRTICWRMAPISARCRTCSDTRTCGRR